jgi:hypothetical protein
MIEESGIRKVAASVRRAGRLTHYGKAWSFRPLTPSQVREIDSAVQGHRER